MRVVLISHVLPAVHGLYSMLQAAGHQPVALLCTRERHERYGELEELLRQAPPELAVVMPATRDQIAPLLRTFEPDAAFCAGFPWKIPPDALAVPKLGVVNGHPSLLPSYRGPTPVSWAIRNGENELGFTFHYMDAELDTGNVLAQAPFPLGGECSWDELSPKVVGAAGALFPRVLERLEAGDPGDPQDGDGSYFGFFEPEYVRIDWSRPALEIERQVRAWCFHSAVAGDRGALAEIDGETVRVLRVSLEPAEGTPMACGDGTMWVVETEAL
jgi:methionyl-tRNA formyltransferase